MLNKRKKRKYFINFIQDYFKSLHGFSLPENYHLHTFKVAKKAGYTDLIAFVKGGIDLMKEDPNLKILKEEYGVDIKIVSYNNILNYLLFIIKYSLKFKNSTFYINGHNLYMYMCTILPKVFSFGLARNIFMAHTQPIRGGLGNVKIKQFLQDKIVFKYFVNRLRLNNITEKVFLENRKISKDKLFVVPLVVDQYIFYKVKDYKDRKDLLYFGQLTKKKNITTLLKAFKIIIKKEKYQNLKLHVIGRVGEDYDFEGDVKNLELENNIIKYGFVKLEELNNLLNQTLIYLNDSQDEGQCVAVYEVALTGNALCLPDIMSFRDVFKDKAQFHKVGDYEKLAKDIEEYLENPDLIKIYNERTIQMINENYNEEIIEDKMKELFTF